MKYLLFAGSLRTNSFNKKLLPLAAEVLKKDPMAQVEIFDIKNLNLPVYDQDIEDKGLPEGVLKFAKLVSDSGALVIASPEYNGSISSPLKNLIDWVSRVKPLPWASKPILLMGASIGMFAANRGLVESRVPFDKLTANVFAKNFGLANAGSAFDSLGNLVHEDDQKRLENAVQDFSVFANKFN